MDPIHHRTVYAVAEESESPVFKTVDGGKTWMAASLGLGNISVTSLAIDPIHPRTLIVGTDSRVFRAGGVFETSDGGQSWHGTSTGLGPLGVGPVTVDPSEPQAVYLIA